ncbi:IPL1 [Hepatospora eriocheir]|uniref:Aurora kinase n=1 Tax=Hepatospora eriocheir TaxID=1081669 RepID=A0A1X0QD78_9MICR|nr:IPL1 [Hepatospora eriocheir]
MIKFITIDDFELGKPVGIGRFGQVWLARHRELGFVCAIKMLDRNNIVNNTDVKRIRREIEIHLNMRHENILNMFGYFYDSRKIYCILEYAPMGDLWRYLHENGKLSENKTSKFIYQLSDAINYLHKHNIIHRDIKPENILLGKDLKLKLCDFGWCVYNADKKRQTFCGTAEYLPPELCDDKFYDKSADIWCIGILAYEMCTGNTPFGSQKSIRMMKQKIVDDDIKFPDYLSPDIVDFISKCCSKNPETRITLNEIFCHPFLLKYKE